MEQEGVQIFKYMYKILQFLFCFALFPDALSREDKKANKEVIFTPKTVHKHYFMH